MSLRLVTSHDLGTLDWADAGESHWKIVADVTCSVCGAYQAADSDPLTEKALATVLCVRLFNSAGWRVSEDDHLLCPRCAAVG